MNLQTIQLNISSDIFDKVMSFLEILPKNKIEIVKNNNFKRVQQKKRVFGGFFSSFSFGWA